MSLYLFGLVLLGWCLIYPLTDFYVRFLNPTTVRKKNVSGRQLYLTFDDGPDPVYTPQILRVLAESEVPACFFLVAAKAEQYPQIVAEILRAGHEIGLHTIRHRHAYSMFARASRASVASGKAALERLAGRPVVWFRPPWGALNLFQFLTARRLRLQIVLWSANARDWKAGTGRRGILQRLARKIGSGAVVVLHDAGGEAGAPQNTVAALPEFIAACRAGGYRFCSLNDGEASQHVWSRCFTSGRRGH